MLIFTDVLRHSYIYALQSSYSMNLCILDLISACNVTNFDFRIDNVNPEDGHALQVENSTSRYVPKVAAETTLK